jgi:hypothetical protein
MRPKCASASGPSTAGERVNSGDVHGDVANRRRLVRARWVELGGAAVAGAGLVLVCLWASSPRLERLMEVPLWVVVGAALICVLWVTWRGRGRLRAFLGIRGAEEFVCYPPVWVAGLVGASLVVVAVSWVEPVRDSVTLRPEGAVRLAAWSLLGAMGTVLLVAVVAGAVWYTRSRRYSDTRESERGSRLPTAATLPTTLNALVEWLSDDDPVVTAEQDAFGHTRIARRIANRLAEDNPPAQALLGDLGSGKTTVRNLVREQLERRADRAPHVRLVEVELWQYETTVAAVQGVISALVDALARDVSVLALRGLPESYAQAMSSAGGTWSALVGLVQGAGSAPVDTLEHIDRIATAVGRRYVMWIEDLERFTGHDVGAEAETTAADSERLNPIRALLYALDRLHAVSVVMATTRLDSRFDVDKIARFIEPMPRLPPHQVWQLLGMFRRGCREQPGVIDPADPKVREPLNKLEEAPSNDLAMWDVEHVTSSAAALTILFSTPRALKQGLRRVLDTWRQLAGELDFDDLLAMGLLREARRDLFDIVRQNVDRQRLDLSAPSEKGAREEVRKQVDATKLSLPTNRAFKQIFDLVFPGNMERWQKPQGFFAWLSLGEPHAVHWQRFLEVPELLEHEKDQPVLRVIQKDDDEALLSLIENPERCGAVEAFAAHIPGDRRRRLLVPLAERRAVEAPETWPDLEPPGVEALWRVWAQGPHAARPRDALDEVLGALAVAVPRSLRLAWEIRHWFAAASARNDLLSADRAEEARSRLRAGVVCTYQGQADAFADAARGAQGDTLLRLCWEDPATNKIDSPMEPFAGWESLAPTVLEAAQVRPREMLPQLASLVTVDTTVHAERGGPRSDRAFDPDRANRLFGGADRVFAVFQRQDNADCTEDASVEAVLRAIRQERAGGVGHSE